jgi:sortase A
MSSSARTTATTVPVSHADLIGLYRKALIAGVSFESLDHKISQLWQRSTVTQERETQDDLTWQQKLWGVLPKIVRVGSVAVPVLVILAGVALAGSAIWPIALYYFQTLPQAQAQQLATPIPPDTVLDVMPQMIANGQSQGQVAGDTVTADNELDPIMVDAKLDYTNLNNWFADGGLPVLQHPQSDDGSVTEYRLDIPKVEITNAVVKVGGDDLNEHLVQYEGTAYPGKSGSPVIFGHSILRQFYNPKESNPRRYMSIFSKIMTLDRGDRIYLTVGNAQYTYVVEEKTEVKPTDTFILSQRYDVKQLKLVTCVPEGTFLRRGVVTARLLATN